MATRKKSIAEPECPWETGKLGMSIEHARPASAAMEKAVDDALGLQLISIRLPKAMIDDLKFLAEREGLGYQPLIRRVMKLYIHGEYKAIARNQLSPLGEAPLVKLETPKPVPKKVSAGAAANAPKSRKRTAG
jgi:hypothetical protein